jgi:hypothetical protein
MRRVETQRRKGLNEKKVERSKHGVGKGERGERAKLKEEEVEKRGGGISERFIFPRNRGRDYRQTRRKFLRRFRKKSNFSFYL